MRWLTRLFDFGAQLKNYVCKWQLYGTNAVKLAAKLAGF